MIKEIAFSSVPVTDVKRARAFYEGVMGLKPTMEAPGGVWVEYDIGAATFGIGAFPGWTPSDQGALITFEVDDVASEIARLKSKGVKIHMDTMETPICHFAIIGDSEGNKIGIHKRKQS
jgi:predicted enzyme related to lactoylglutathione lyase